MSGIGSLWRRALNLTILLLILLVLSASLNLYMHLRLRLMRSLITNIGYTPHGLWRPPGDEAPELAAKRLDGSPVVIDPKASKLPTVIYVFSPRCSWCDRNLENVKALARASTGHFAFVGLALRSTDLQNYLAESDLGFEVFMEPTWRTLVDYGLGATPTTIIVTPRGRIQAVWQGAYIDRTAREIEAFFDIRLPGLRDSQTFH